jgi:hypothetical protein
LPPRSAPFDRMSGSGCRKSMLSRRKSMCDCKMPMLSFAKSMLANKMERASHRMRLSRVAMRMYVPIIGNAAYEMWFARDAKWKISCKM